MPFVSVIHLRVPSQLWMWWRCDRESVQTHQRHKKEQNLREIFVFWLYILRHFTWSYDFEILYLFPLETYIKFLHISILLIKWKEKKKNTTKNTQIPWTHRRYIKIFWCLHELFFAWSKPRVSFNFQKLLALKNWSWFHAKEISITAFHFWKLVFGQRKLPGERRWGTQTCMWSSLSQGKPMTVTSH